MKKYDSYKDSGIEWIGEIPEHWEVSRIKYYLDYQKGKNPKEINFDKGSTSEIYLAMDFLRGEPRQILYVDDTDGYVKVDENEILLLWDGSNAGEFILSKRGILSSTMAVIYLNNIKKRYSWYYLKNFEPRLKENTIGMGIPHVNGEELKNGYITIPPKSEQTSIANFLDLKTSEIDEIIADKKRLLELYEEEKTSIINQAVTKGIDPDAPMKDSGIEWLGEIPEHWEVKKLKYIAKINSTKNQSYKDYEDEVVFLPMEKVKENGSFEDDITKPINELWNGYTYFEKGDILIAKITPCFENGKGTLLSNLKTNFGFGSTEFHVVRANLANSNYLFYVTRSHVFMSIGEAFMTGAAGQKRVPSDFISEFVLALPSKSEQQSIVHHIESECSKIDFKKARTEELIELLTEYRAALISEAVTGKIKLTED